MSPRALIPLLLILCQLSVIGSLEDLKPNSDILPPFVDFKEDDGLDINIGGRLNLKTWQKVLMQQTFEDIVEDIREFFPPNICVQGIYVRSNGGATFLNLMKGRLGNLESVYSFELVLVSEDKENWEVDVRLSFKNLPVIYDFKYSSTRLMYTRQRTGYIQLLQLGPTVMSVVVNVPKAIDSILNDVTRPASCYVKVNSVSVLRFGNKLAVHRISYWSLVGATVRTVTRIIEDIEKEIQNNMQAALVYTLRSVLMKHKNVCGDNGDKEDAKPPDCESVRNEGQRGYLEGLASRYADLYNTHYRDVLDHLEELRRREWAELSPRIRILGTPTTPPPGPAPSTPLTRVPLTTSHSQPIYVPGKYSPSSCLTDREEDEIYGFAGYGVYGKQMLQRQQQAKLVITPRQNYQNCLSPRSAYFYEFPPNERAGKKKTSFSRFLRHLTTHRKEKSSSSRLTSSRSGTPDNLDTPPTLLPPMDYERLRFLQKNQNSSNTFEETIHRLKVQEALKKKERFDREHEEILRDIRQGLLQLGRGGGRSDDTYMYDDDVQRLGQHWYDEPPYESDPEDFLMADTTNNSRVCFTLNMRTDGRSSGESAVISLRSAGDISLPHHQRGLLLPQSGPYPPTLIPLTHARNNRESGDYAASDVQSICSRLSSLSMETSRSETTDHYQRLRSYNGGDSAISPGHSSDYAEQDELVTVHTMCGNSSVAHRVRGLKEKSTGKVISSRHHHHHTPQKSPVPHHSSAESLPSGSSTQALVPPSSNHSSEESASPSEKPLVVAQARALVDYTPSPYEKDVLKFKKGDMIEVLSMNVSGIWRGQVHGRVGNFKFMNVELLSEESLRPRPCRHRPQTLEQMLRTIHMEDHMSLFVLNGFEDLDAFCDIDEKDLDYLGILDLQKRAKILAAVQVLNEYESPDECSSSADEGRNSQLGLVENLPPSDTSAPPINCKEAAQIMQQTYLPCAPVSRPSHTLEMNVFSDKTSSDTVADKLGVVKYIAAELNCESGNPQNRNCSTLSEKSSDSGVSSSSLSSSNHNASRNKQRRSGSKATLIESPTTSYVGHYVSERKD